MDKQIAPKKKIGGPIKDWRSRFELKPTEKRQSKPLVENAKKLLDRNTWKMDASRRKSRKKDETPTKSLRNN